MKYKIPIILFLVLTAFKTTYGQSYGLGFYSHEVVQDQRTGLDLSPGKTLCFDHGFEIEFDLSFLSGRNDYFGYITRFVGSNNQNIDFIYDKKLEEKQHFKVIIGDRFSNIAFNISKDALFKGWNKVKFRFDYDRKLLQVSSGTYIASTRINVKQKDCFKILFGTNEYLGFKTNDVPPMKIRNIGIYEQGSKKYFWPLDEFKDQEATEQINGQSGAVLNPLWIKKLHYDWQLVLAGRMEGQISVAFDQRKERLLLIGPDSLISYRVKEDRFDTVKYTSGRQNLMKGNQSLYDNDKGRLINFYYDQRKVSTFDTVKRSWSKNFAVTEVTYFWHLNKFYLPADTSLYVFGGYGHFVYKNQIERYHFATDTWQKIRVSGDTLVPRYLAALGSSGNGAYLMGGYGSSTGQQMLNPRNLYDLLYFDAGKNTIKKIYDLKITGEDFVFANSLIINEKDKTYYGLVFPKHKYRSNLQLIEGSLEKPEFKRLGSQIPYLFHDISSFAEFYYCQESKRFLAVTLFTDDKGRTSYSIYSLYSAPIAQLSTNKPVRSFEYLYIIVASLLLIVIAVLMYRRRRPVLVTLTVPAESNRSAEPVAPPDMHVPAVHKNAIFLFGDMQVFDRSGTEITKQFTPLIRELFLVILLYTIRWERGISSDKLKELLWMDKSVESARNNRSVNIAKLKNILEKIGDCEVSMETGYWRINFKDKTTYVDYQEYFNIVNSKKEISRDKIGKLIKIIKRGSFLSTAAYEWMDPFKSEISNEIIDAYLHFARSVQIHEDPELLIEVANYVFYFDSVNEEAMVVKCKALVHLGKHSQSGNTYENFCKEYKLLYGADFTKSFNEVLNSSLNDI
jgi:DNA-binding SARP family transcriptional activator